MGQLLICSGAGLSAAAPSNVPTFRTGAGAMWDNHDVREVCYLPTFLDNYDRVWEFYNARRVALKDTLPNEAHVAIGELVNEAGARCATTNVDTLLNLGGVPDDKCLYLHGKITEVIHDYRHADAYVEDIGFTAFDHKAHPHGYAKPNVTFFAESCPAYEDFNHWVCDLGDMDIVLVVGASDVVVRFGEWCKYTGLGGLPYVVRINPEPITNDSDQVISVAQSSYDAWLPYCATEVLGNTAFRDTLADFARGDLEVSDVVTAICQFDKAQVA